MNAFRIVAAGDSALTIEFEARIDAAINAQAIHLAEALREAPIAGIRDVVPTYRSTTVFFDPLTLDCDLLTAQIERAAVRPATVALSSGDPLRIPVCYGGELGSDIGDVAVFGRMEESDVVRLHTARVYRVFMLGFVPGFAYLGTVDAPIAAPRRSSPRLRVPAGSVGIAGFQTGVYPSDTPGGWQLIGRTPSRLFDANRREPCLLKAGDSVQFHAIDREQYDRLQAAN